MSNDTPIDASLAALIRFRDEAVGELAKAKKDLEKQKARVSKAETSVATLNAAVAHISGEASAPKSQKDAILEVIQTSGADGLTAQQILAHLEFDGITLDAKNPQASVHVAADRLAKDGLIEIVLSGSGGKLFKRKAMAA